MKVRVTLVFAAFLATCGCIGSYQESVKITPEACVISEANRGDELYVIVETRLNNSLDANEKRWKITSRGKFYGLDEKGNVVLHLQYNEPKLCVWAGESNSCSSGRPLYEARTIDLEENNITKSYGYYSCLEVLSVNTDNIVYRMTPHTEWTESWGKCNVCPEN